MALKLNLMGYKPIKSEFLVPTYYKAFFCKGSNCRNTCCSGWKITIPMDQYFILHGINCNKNLREKIDKTFRKLTFPSKERYAEIAHNYEGNCHLLSEEGLCSLHAACGEQVLPSVCRYYPRGPRINYRFEVSCSNSCEKTLELLFENTEKIEFEYRELMFNLPLASTSIPPTKVEAFVNIQKNCFEILQNRTLSLPRRILSVGIYLEEQQNSELIKKQNFNPEKVKIDVNDSYEHLKSVSEWFIENNPSISDFNKEIIEFYCNNDIETKYYENLNHFKETIPEFDIWFEKMLINNLFFRQFPYLDGIASFDNVFVALVGIYVVMRYIGINMMRGKNSLEDFVDIMAKTFRVISHTKFENNMIYLLNKEKITSFDALYRLMLV